MNLISASLILVGLFFPAMGSEATLESLELKTLTNKTLKGSELKGKALLVVNTASGCGYTPQLKGLQQLHSTYKKQGLFVIGIPSNQFNQERLKDNEISQFCKLKYGVDFTLLRKSPVNGPERNPLINWLVKNDGAGGKDIAWNFEKFIVGKDGKVLARFPSAVVPEDPRIKAAIEKALSADEF